MADERENNVIPLRRRVEETPEALGILLRGSQDRRQAVLFMLDQRGHEGLTWKEVADVLAVGHGTASSLLSYMHKADLIRRLAVDQRDGVSIYVLPEYVNGRRTAPRRRASGIAHEMADLLKRMHKGCDHPEYDPHPSCRQCEIREVLVRFERQTRVDGS